jgi:hypothetical protein
MSTNGNADFSCWFDKNSLFTPRIPNRNQGFMSEKLKTQKCTSRNDCQCQWCVQFFRRVALASTPKGMKRLRAELKRENLT